MNSEEVKRDKWLKESRPQIETIDFSQSMSASEAFQNSTLRPILKMQHDLIHQLFRHQSGLENLEVLSQADQRNRIQKVLEKKIDLRNQMIGIVLALMTESEVETYYKDHSEFKRRIKTMLVERLNVNI